MEELPGSGAPAASPIAPSISETEAVVSPSPMLDIAAPSTAKTHLRPKDVPTKGVTQSPQSLRSKIKSSFSSFGSKLKRKLGGGKSVEKGRPIATSAAVTVTAV
jgi:hypothetical protein